VCLLVYLKLKNFVKQSEIDISNKQKTRNINMC